MSIDFTAGELACWTTGTVVSGTSDERFSGVSTDTRTLEPGVLFVALRGPNHDAHSYLGRALEGGATGLLVEKGRELPAAVDREPAVVAVPDTTRALGDLARGHFASFDGPIVAVTGSNGKTTTKEMCAGILEELAPCLRNRGNLNNQYGLPLTLLEREGHHRAVVVEIGMNHRGEIGPLAAIARPTIGIVTNIGTAHIEHLGSRDEIAAEKGDLVAALPADGVAVLNADDPFFTTLSGRSRARVLSFGRDPGADVHAADLTPLAERGFAFDLVTPEGRVPVNVQGLGDTTVINALAAAAGALAAGAGLDAISHGLSHHRGVSGRMEKVALPRNIIVINDTYNANPQSMEVALRSLAELSGQSRTIAVLGDMGELGDTASEAHRAAGRLVGELGLDYLFALGEHASEIASGATGAGMDEVRIHTSSAHDSISAALHEVLQGDDWVLVKGSRAMQMEKIVHSLARASEAEDR